MRKWREKINENYGRTYEEHCLAREQGPGKSVIRRRGGRGEWEGANLCRSLFVNAVAVGIRTWDAPRLSRRQ